LNYALNHPNENVHSIILCGGSGTRLWPLSRKAYPKQFLSLGSSQRSLLQLSVDRIKNISKPENRWLITTPNQENLCRNQLGKSINHYLIEPQGRNTAPAIAYSAWELYKQDPNSIMVILSADHSIQNVRSFEQSIFDAIQLASQNLFVTVGIQPNHPATGFGYIEVGLPLDAQGKILSPQKLHDTSATGYSVRSFREKPNLAAAEQFLRTGKYLWNAGIFVWKTKTFWDAFSHIQPNMAEIIQNSDKESFEKNYAQLENISIDVAFLEQTSHVACVPANFDWNDVGSWSAVRECFSQDNHGNTISGPVFTLETKNSVIHSTKQFVSVIGMENVSVVATEEAILVMPLNRDQEVRKVVSYLEQNKPELL
jgi:mannose-1-phosphate guanylyltransferase